MAAAGNVSNLPKNTGKAVGSGEIVDNDPLGANGPSGPQYGEFGAKDNPEVIAAIVDAVAKMKTLIAERKEINDEIAAVRAGIEARGINKHAFADALRYANMTTANQDGYDLSMGISRKAIELPIQTPLFAGEAGAEAKEPAKH